MMPLGAYRAAGMLVGLGSDVAAGPEISMLGVIRAAAVTQRALELTGRADPALDRSLAVDSSSLTDAACPEQTAS